MKTIKQFIPLYIASIVLLALAAAAVSQSVTVLTAAMDSGPKDALPIIVLDPGHGGEDGGAVSPNGVPESSLNLEIGLRTRDLLRFLGLSVKMTRETDVSIYGPEAETVSEKKVSDLKNRVRLVGEQGRAILVSIHQNMFSQPQYDGAQVFYADTTGSRELAEHLQELIREKLSPQNHRQAKPALTVYLLKHVRCPGILLECGFLSNPEEERKLQSPDYQRLLAAAVSAALCQYLSQQSAA